MLVPLAPGIAAGVGSPNDIVVVGGQHLAFGTGPDNVHVGVSAHSGPVSEGCWAPVPPDVQRHVVVHDAT